MHPSILRALRTACLFSLILSLPNRPKGHPSQVPMSQNFLRTLCGHPLVRLPVRAVLQYWHFNVQLQRTRFNLHLASTQVHVGATTTTDPNFSTPFRRRLPSVSKQPQWSFPMGPEPPRLSRHSACNLPQGARCMTGNPWSRYLISRSGACAYSRT
ncbi:hypothetical protein LXA43DRAFT_685774 [Ganoderma leucocontextum]|nr:hypothetical protein LXA43DRAFT_685774 [Ganoderma leucocontextum]